MAESRNPPADEARNPPPDDTDPPVYVPPVSDDIQDWGSYSVQQAENVQLPDGTWSHGGWVMVDTAQTLAQRRGAAAAEAEEPTHPRGTATPSAARRAVATGSVGGTSSA